MKILFITSSLEPKDGWGRYSHSVVNEVAKKNEVTVISHSIYKTSPISQKKLLYSPLSMSNPFRLWSVARFLNREIASLNPEVIHFLVEPYIFLLPFLKIPKTTKTFLTVHGTFSFIPNLFKKEKLKLFILSFFLKRAYEKVNKIISVSNFTKKFLLQEYEMFYKQKLNESKISVITNGIDVSAFPQVAGEKSKIFKNILFVGAIKERKGLKEALEALAVYKKRFNNNFKYLIVGGSQPQDKYTEELKNLTLKLSLTENVEFKGFVSQKEIQDLYAIADLFLMLPIMSGNSFEGFGLVYLEANLYGVPVIGALNSGASDAIDDGVSGFLVFADKPEEVAEKIYAVLESEKIKSEDCVRWAKKHDIAEKVKVLEALYVV